MQVSRLSMSVFHLCSDFIFNVFSRFLDQSLTNTEEKLDKHRFLVQSKVIEDAEYSRILELAPQSRADEVAYMSGIVGCIFNSRYCSSPKCGRALKTTGKI